MALITNTEADTLLSASSVWTALTEALKTTHIESATVLLNSLNWKGVVTSVAQADSWPRTSVLDREGRVVTSTEVPSAIQNACAQLALKAAAGKALYPDYASQKVISKSASGGPASVQTVWSEGSSEPSHKWPEIHVLFSQFIISNDQLLRG